LEALRQDVGTTWLLVWNAGEIRWPKKEPLTIEETAAKYVRPKLRQVFIDLCRKPIRDYLNRFGFKSNMVKAMYVKTLNWIDKL
jgi:hypothetical protein